MGHKINKSLDDIFSKEELSIVITDSGLGGLSIFSEVVEGLKKSCKNKKIFLTYYNAWPEQNRGYNRITDHKEKLRVFDSALDGMRKYSPDIILIACNTLSVIYSETEFSKKIKIPVVDIVDYGVDLIYKSLNEDEKSKSLILGTVTTAESEEHKNRLVKKGISPEQILSQPCDQLATEIEKGPESAKVSALIKTFMKDAASKIGSSDSNIYTALCCTHFGYSENEIRETLQGYVHGEVKILNPNKKMAEFVIEGCSGKDETSGDYPDVEIQILSKIKWDENKVKSISNIIGKNSPDTAEALKNYKYLSELFVF